jgi:hypothetical protein
MSRTIFAPRSGLACSLSMTVVAVGILTIAASAAEPRKIGASTAKADEVEMFAAIKRGDIEVKLVAKDDTKANVLIKNKTKRPLNVKLPEAFAGVPVLAQLGPGLGGGGNNRDGDDNNQNQAVGGGFGGGMMGGGGGMMGGMGFNVAPEKIGKLKVACVCLEHGKKDPNPRVQYEIKKIDDFTQDTKVHEVLKLLASGKVPQRVAQAATWHFANGMSWDALAAKKVNRLGVPDTAYFSPAELRAALQLSAVAERLADAKKDTGESSSSGDSLTKR